jgi:hypothetical protein
MKRFLAIIAIIALSFGTAFGQDSQQESKRRGNEWMEKVKSEKIAYFTSELGLTSQEAQAFWPVYNEYQEKCNTAHFATMKALWAMKKACCTKNGNADVSEKDAKDLLDAYLNAYESECKIMGDIPDYSNILSAEKQARLFVAEEMFRMKMIGRLRGKDDAKSDSSK